MACSKKTPISFMCQQYSNSTFPRGQHQRAEAIRSPGARCWRTGAEHPRAPLPEGSAHALPLPGGTGSTGREPSHRRGWDAAPKQRQSGPVSRAGGGLLQLWLGSVRFVIASCSYGAGQGGFCLRDTPGETKRWPWGHELWVLRALWRQGRDILL